MESDLISTLHARHGGPTRSPRSGDLAQRLQGQFGTHLPSIRCLSIVIGWCDVRHMEWSGNRLHREMTGLTKLVCCSLEMARLLFLESARGDRCSVAIALLFTLLTW
jgi:hypothetical protein